MEASLTPSPTHGIKWALPSSGPEDYPPSVGPDEYTIINPDFWAEGVDAGLPTPGLAGNSLRGVKRVLWLFGCAVRGEEW